MNSNDINLKSIEGFDEILSYLPDSILLINADGNIVFINKQALQLFGYKKEELVGKKIEELIPERFRKDHPPYRDSFFHNASTRSMGKLENLFALAKNGKEIPVDISLSSIKIEDNDFVCASVRDITRINNLLVDIKRKEKKFHSLLDAIPDAIVMINIEGDIKYVNDEAKRIFGYKENELLGEKIEILVPERFRKDHPEKRTTLFHNSATRQLGDLDTIFGLRKDGSEFPADISLNPIETEEGKWVTAAIRDVSKHKLMVDDIKIARSQAVEANKAKSLFLANMSHDIRTPMNAVLGFSELLSKMVTDEKQLDYLSSIRSSGKSLLGIINDILDLSKVEAGKLILEFSAVNVFSVFNEMEQIFSQKIDEKGLDFLIEVQDDTQKIIILDEIRLRQILINLIGNAVKFTETGYVKLKVSSVFSKTDDSKIDLSFSVEDTGIGIPDDQKDKVFVAFEQQKGQSHSKYGGTGLGLAITKKLVEMMNGNINVTGEFGKGSSFNVTLHDLEIASVSDDEMYSAESLDIDSIKFDPAVILIVDDVELIRKLVRGFLEQYNLTIHEATDGDEVIEKTRKFKPDLIFMDIKMTGMGGYEATTILKNDKELKNIPVIALTASVLAEEEQKAMNICDGFLRKPVSRNNLIKELTKFLKHTKEEVVQPEIATIDSEENIEEDARIISESNEYLPEILDKLKNDFEPVWNELRETLTINEIEEFAQKIKELGRQYQYRELVNWGTMLEKQAGMFEMDAMSSTLESFPEIIQELQRIIQKMKIKLI